MYRYEEEKHKLWTDEGLDMIIKVREEAHRLFKIAGCATLENLIRGCTGDSFTMLAVVDWLEEKKTIRRIYQDGVSTQRQIYTWGVFGQ